MKAILVEKIGSFTIRDTEIPKPGTDEVLVKVHVTGLCRTDLKIIRSGHRDLVLPRIPGEEVVGAVCEMGTGVKDLTPGQRVYIYPGKSCGNCKPCLSGAENLCREMEIMGFHRHGGFAEYVVVPAKSVIPISPGLSDEKAVFAEPLSCCLNALELARLRNGEAIGIWGAGPAGSLLYRAAQALGARPFIVEPDPRRLSRFTGSQSPPDTRFDVCVIAVGSLEAYSQALSRLDARGRIVAFSGLPPDKALFGIDFNQVHYMEQTIIGAYGCSYRHGQAALEYIEKGEIEVQDLVSHRMPLSELERALELVEKRECMKVHLYPEF